MIMLSVMYYISFKMLLCVNGIFVTSYTLTFVREQRIKCLLKHDSLQFSCMIDAFIMTLMTQKVQLS